MSDQRQIKLTQLANPKIFRAISRPLKPLCLLLGSVFIVYGVYIGLFSSPSDYQQGEYVRLMYIHVPSAWLGMGIYAFMVLTSLSGLIWRHRLAEIMTEAAAPVGLIMTFLCLVTGMIWGKPTWGAWWVWDARLTSVFILFLLYLGYWVLIRSFDDRTSGLKTGSVLVVLGAVNLPIIKYSVEWWNTLHQPASLSSLERLRDPAMPPEMLIPLLVMAMGLALFCGWLILFRAEILILRHKQRYPRR